MADSDLDNAGVKAVITLGVLACVGILAVVIAKLVQFCMKSHYTDNEDNEIDENTRDLIRARLSVIQFKKREIKKARQEKTLSVFQKWKEIAKNRKRDRNTALKSERPEENGNVVINIDKIEAYKTKENGIVENGNGKISENGSPRRFPFFNKNKPGSGGVKPPTDTFRVTSLNKVNLEQQELPVQRGRPVSSKPRVSPNVTLTDVDKNNSTKGSGVRAVHFEDNGDTNKGNTDSERKVKINSVVPTNIDPIFKSDSDKVNKETIEKSLESNKTSEEKT